MADPQAPPPVKKKGPGVLLVLVALVLLALSVYVIAAFVPIVSCPPCAGSGTLKMVYHNTKTGGGDREGECPPCKGKGRITLLQKFNIAPLDPSKIPLPDLNK